MKRLIVILLLAGFLGGCSTKYVPMVLTPADLEEPAECTRPLPELPKRKIGNEGLKFATFAKDWRLAKSIIAQASAEKSICKTHFAALRKKAGGT